MTSIRIDGSHVSNGALFLLGSQGDDILIGGSKNDTMGNAYKYGTIGNDTMTGGAGEDRFVFKSVAPTSSVITDFTRGEDVINTDNRSFAELTITDTAEGALVKMHDDVFVTLNGVAAADLTADDFYFVGPNAFQARSEAADYVPSTHSEALHAPMHVSLV